MASIAASPSFLPEKNGERRKAMETFRRACVVDSCMSTEKNGERRKAMETRVIR